ncbi:hypothetical protein CS542_07010 [Pedobacter sp. IW39]|nr:hypothetical protein CS542_07010 [Pedobacter sp. IW39]
MITTKGNGIEQDGSYRCTSPINRFSAYCMDRESWRSNQLPFGWRGKLTKLTNFKVKPYTFLQQ